jgi:Fe-S cluster biogenesis protein NfuA
MVGGNIQEKVEFVMKQIRAELLSRSSDVELIRTTNHGVVRICLSGQCCSDRLNRLLTTLDIEKTLKRHVSGVKVVMEDDLFEVNKYQSW